ncbi:Protein of unknown function [Gryllus bimaculatus]|nr:Protein of unknown function [Gryllus bimaculatus]
MMMVMMVMMVVVMVMVMVMVMVVAVLRTRRHPDSPDHPYDSGRGSLHRRGHGPRQQEHEQPRRHGGPGDRKSQSQVEHGGGDWAPAPRPAPVAGNPAHPGARRCALALELVPDGAILRCRRVAELTSSWKAR